MNDAPPSKQTDNEWFYALGRLLPKQDWLVIGWVFGIKAGLFVFGVKSYQVLENKPVAAGMGWLEIWNRWDSLHYLRLAEFGYQATDPLKTWFYPFYPWCVRFLNYLIGHYLLSALILSGLACAVAAILFRRLVMLDDSDAVAQRAVWFLLIFPTAYFLHIGYTESLFLALCLGAFLAARTERWWLAGALAACCCMTRAFGLVLIPVLALEAFDRFRTARRWDWRWLWLAIAPLGFGVYLLVNWKVEGNPFAFLALRHQLFAMSISWPWVGIREAIGNMDREPSDAEIVGAQEVYFAILGLICAIVSWFKLRPSYAAWSTGAWLLSTSVNSLQSVPRYLLPVFPLFILLARGSRNRFWFAIITFWSILFLALFSAIFVRGWWAF
jgi:Mannosyltransferase (PIG-V)